MTTGAVIFAHNNSEIDYTKLAVFSASRVKQFLNIPITIITDNQEWLESNYPNHPFENVIVVDLPKANRKTFYDGTLSSFNSDWRNFSRSSVYNLSPYDTTLVIDSDYLINSNFLKSALEQDVDFQIYRKSFDLSGWRSTSYFNRINPYSVPFYWATVFVFRKNIVMESFFKLVSYIKENWDYFKVLYSIDSHIFRNDHAFSIAIHIMNGKTNGEFAVELPGSMIYCTDRDYVVSLTNDELSLLVEKEKYPGEYILAKTKGLDVHILNKMSLSRLIDGGTGV